MSPDAEDRNCAASTILQRHDVLAGSRPFRVNYTIDVVVSIVMGDPALVGWFLFRKLPEMDDKNRGTGYHVGNITILLPVNHGSQWPMASRCMYICLPEATNS